MLKITVSKFSLILKKRLSKGKSQPIPKAVFCLLLTGETPISVELSDIQTSLTNQHQIPQSTFRLIKTYSKTHYPMAVLSMAVLDLQSQSMFFNKQQSRQIKKQDYWDSYLDDSIRCLSLLPIVATLIYTERYD